MMPLDDEVVCPEGKQVHLWRCLCNEGRCDWRRVLASYLSVLGGEGQEDVLRWRSGQDSSEGCAVGDGSKSSLEGGTRPDLLGASLSLLTLQLARSQVGADRKWSRSLLWAAEGYKWAATDGEHPALALPSLSSVSWKRGNYSRSGQYLRMSTIGGVAWISAGCRRETIGCDAMRCGG